MTRRGSLVYYLVAVVVGAFIASLLLWFWARSPDGELVFPRRGSSPGESYILTFLGIYVAALVTGAAPALLYAFLLRQLMRYLRRTWLLVVGGALIAVLLTFLLGGLHTSLHEGESSPSNNVFTMLFLYAPRMLSMTGVWVVAVAGGASAFMLYRIHRAFEPREETRAQT